MLARFGSACRQWCLVLIASLVFSVSAAEAIVPIDPTAIQVDLSNSTTLLEDPTGLLTIDDERKADAVARFEARPIRIKADALCMYFVEGGKT